MEWRPVTIEPFAGDYEVSDTGLVRSLKHGRYHGRLLTIGHFRKGYANVQLTSSPQHGSKSKTLSLHAVVAAAFIGPRPQGATINHKDGNKDNNCVDNLEYVTFAENMAHAVRIGLHTKGERHGSAKLTDSQVREILQRHSTESNSAIGREFHVSHEAIRRIRLGRQWTHIHRMGIT